MCHATLQCISTLSPAACHASQCAMQLSSVSLGCLQQHVILPNVPCNSPVYIYVVSSSMSCFPMCHATLQCISRLSPAACHTSQCAMQLSSVSLGCLQQHVILPNVPCNSPVYIYVVSSSMSCFPMCHATLQCISRLSPAACHTSQCAMQLSSVSLGCLQQHVILPNVPCNSPVYIYVVSSSMSCFPMCHATLQCISRLSPAACHTSQCAMQLSSVSLGCLQQHVMLPNVPGNSPVYL